MNHNLVLVEFLVFPPGTTTAWDCVIASPWEEAQPVGQNPFFLAMGPFAFTVSEHFCRYKRKDAVQQGHAEGFISIYT